MSRVVGAVLEGGRSASRVVGIALIGLIRVYQYTISPLLGECCKYYPSCSNYAIGALREHGVVRGSLLAGWRLLRCNPFSYGGYDPVPLRGDRVPGHKVSARV